MSDGRGASDRRGVADQTLTRKAVEQTFPLVATFHSGPALLWGPFHYERYTPVALYWMWTVPSAASARAARSKRRRGPSSKIASLGTTASSPKKHSHLRKEVTLWTWPRKFGRSSG